MANYIQEILALTMRWVQRLSRERFSLLFTLAQPMLFWLILFGSLFQGAVDIRGIQAPNYMSFLAAGVVVMTVLNNGLAGGVDLLFDKEGYRICEVNSSPGFEGMDKFCKTNIAEQIVTYVKHKIGYSDNRNEN